MTENADFSGYSLIVLADDVEPSSELCKKLELFVSSGGKILSTGRSMVDDGGFASPLWSFEYCGLDESRRAYFKLPLTEGLADMPYNATPAQILMRAGCGSSVIAKRISPMFDKYEKDGHVFVYNPPSESAEYDAALISREGSVAHIAFSVFRAYRESASMANAELVRATVDALGVKRLVSHNLPPYAAVTLFESADADILFVKSDFERSRELYFGDAFVGVFGEYKKAELLPEKEEKLALENMSGVTRVKLPEHFSFLVIKLYR